jgi:Uma2 family endonuclease
VREYWLVNPDTLEVLIYTLDDGRYGLPRAASLQEAVAVARFEGLDLEARPEDL